MRLLRKQYDYAACAQLMLLNAVCQKCERMMEEFGLI